MDHANPDTDAERLVLGDALTTVGDPLGSLVAVQAKLMDLPPGDRRRDSLLRLERELIRENEERWFGDLAPAMRRERRVEVRWRLGFLDAVTLRTTSQRFHRELTTSAPAQFLRKVTVDLRDLGPSQTVKDGWLAELHAPNLEVLEYFPHRTTGDFVKVVAARAASWPKLRSLLLWFGGNGLALKFLDPLVDSGALSRLTHFGIKEMPWGNPGLERIAASKLFTQLRSLDLSFGVIDTLTGLERFARLERLDLSNNLFPPERARELKTFFGEKIAIANPYLRPGHAAKVQHYGGVMRRVLAERAADEAWTSEFRPSPYDPSGIVEKELAIPDAIPYLLETLRLEDPQQVPWILEAFEKLGPAAGPDVSNALVLRRAYSQLAFVDPERARGLGLDRTRGIRTRICGRLRDAPEALVAHLCPLLEDDDPEVVLFALGGDGVTDQSYLDYLARDQPDLVPRHLVRLHLDHDDERVREAAASLLAAMHLPEDAGALVAHRTTSARTYPYASWLGSHPRSDEMILRAGVEPQMASVFHVVRRRRCAGLPNDVDALRPILVAALEKRYETTREREHAHRFAAETIDELRLADLAPLAPPVNRRVPTLEEADALWIAGNIDDSTLHHDAAFGHYARFFWADPTCAHAAFQMAWTERAYGSFIAPERISWLRELGVAEDLLTDLARRPPRIIPGHGPQHERPSDAGDPARARILLEAGVFGAAANLFPWKSAEQLAARAAAKAHIERVRLSTR